MGGENNYSPVALGFNDGFISSFNSFSVLRMYSANSFVSALEMTTLALR